MELVVVRMMVITMALIIIMPLYYSVVAKVDIGLIRQLAAKNNVSCILVFGDSSVDPGNNNVLGTTMKSNFPPYGKNFFNGRPTGRFSNGRLATDFIADEAMGFRKIVPPFLDPNLKLEDLPYGVSFASAATGYDDLTANISNVLPVSKQLKYFEHYKIHMRKLLGEKRAEFIIRNALYVLSMGTNDFLQNYFLEDTRPKQYSLQKFEEFLLSQMTKDIEMMHRLGAQRLVVVGVLPLGCIPLMMTLKSTNTCDTTLNNVAHSFNAKLSLKLTQLKAQLGMKTAYVNVFGMIQNAVLDPKKYGFVETTKGCCGTGLVEYGDSCRGLTTCSDPDQYIFWDAVHPTQKMYKIIADEAIESISNEIV